MKCRPRQGLSIDIRTVENGPKLRDLGPPEKGPMFSVKVTQSQIKFAAKRIIQSGWTQKLRCKDVQELSIGMNSVEIGPQSAVLFNLNWRKLRVKWYAKQVRAAGIPK